MSALPARLVGPLEEMPWLDRVGDRVTALLQPLLQAPRAAGVKDVLHGRWLGHALHPVLTDLPIGFWTSAFVLDVAGAGRAARLLNAFACVSVAGTAAAGVADWTATDGRERRLGLLHGLLNTAGLGLQLVALCSRHRRAYRAWSWTGFAVSSAAAYLGGELVFDRGVMVNHDAWVAGPAEWTAALPEAELPEGEMRPAQIGGRTILLSRENGVISAIEDSCTHAGGPLHEGGLVDGVVTCPWHGSRFRVADGTCMGGPATFRQLPLQTRVRKGRIEVRGRRG